MFSKKPKPEPKKKEASPPLTEGETKAGMDRMFQLRDEINSRLEDFYKKSGMEANQVSEVLDNPTNFKDDNDWKEIQSQRQTFRDKIWKMIGLESKESYIKRKEVRIENKKKGKMIGARMKNWLFMK